jgi:hypothetical protein
VAGGVLSHIDESCYGLDETPGFIRMKPKKTNRGELMASAPRPARNEPETQDVFRCAKCGAIFDTQDELREHQESNNHVENNDQSDTEQNDADGASEEYDQLDGSRYPDDTRH